MTNNNYDYVSINYGVTGINTTEQLNNVMNETHVITGRTETKQETYNRVFHNLKWDTPKQEYANDVTGLQNYITDSYINLTKGIVKTMATGVIKRVCKNGVIKYMPHSTYVACNNIVNTGYNDIIFDDLCNEVFIVLWENRDSITYNKDSKSFDLSTLILNCYQCIRRYLYNNKTKIDNTEVSIVDYDNNNDEFITIAINTIDYRRYAIKEYNSNCDNLDDLLLICHSVLYDINRKQKSFIAEKCKKVLQGLLKGMSNKEISKHYNISIHSVTKYRNILNDTYYNLYKKPVLLQETTTTTATTNHNYIKVDFSDLSTKGSYETFKNYFDNVFVANMDTSDTFYHIDNIDNIDSIIENYIYTGNYNDNTYKAIQDIITR